MDGRPRPIAQIGLKKKGVFSMIGALVAYSSMAKAVIAIIATRPFQT